MNKKNLLKKIFGKLADSWALWQAILLLLENEDLDDATIDNLINVMEAELVKVENIQSKRKMKKGIESLKRLKQDEFNKTKQDEHRLDELNTLIENI